MRRVVIRNTKSRKGSKWAQFGRLKRGVTEKRSARKLWALSVLSQIIAARRRGDRAEADRLYRGAWPEKARKRDLKAKGG